ncbi:STAS domain-containing protein [Pseudonocardia kujensis]|uniref:STAS domain-containing protein n=1 Tax=Pseudonocardia kujensis TaxID=1128675 RepID=UPI001E307EE0|nr:STAS domain-containing protein [Pseudonocardia kujensis]MCE0763256.1 STAS domain-containing protein [Pseudonocardia kujensis]
MDDLAPERPTTGCASRAPEGELSRYGQAAVRAVCPAPGLTLLMVSGELDLTNSAEVAAWVEAQDAERVVVDLSMVGFVAARAVRRLDEAQAVLRRRGTEVRVVVSHNPVLGRVLGLVGSSFDLYDSVALACRRPRPVADRATP